MLSNKRLVVFVVGVFLGLFFSTGTAFAHPKPTAYSPGDGTSMSAPPGEAWVDFDERVTQGTLEVYDPCGQRVDQGNSEVLINRVSVGVSAERAGTYTAVWTVVGQDSHKVSGDWTFTVTEGSSCPGEEPEPEPKGQGDDPNDDGDGQDGSPSEDPTVSGATGSSNDQEDNNDKTRSPDKNNKNSKKNKHSNHRKERDADPSEERSVELISQPGEEPPNNGEIPVDWLLISFVIAGLIGAAGGRIYVDLTGPGDPKA